MGSRPHISLPRLIKGPRQGSIQVWMSLSTKDTKRLSSGDALALWEEYRRTGDGDLRDRLILTFAPLVKYIAYKKLRELPARCEVDDLISCGLEALITSIDRYDPSKGATLEQYSWTRIHGAVIDELRRQDWAPRSLRRWERDINKARDHFGAVHGRLPTPEELAESLGTTPDELRVREHEIVSSEVTSLNTLVIGDGDTTIERIETIADQDGDRDPELATAGNEAREKFRSAFARLSGRERELAVLLYVKELTLREVGEVLGVSESRVCQIHAQLKSRLRHALAGEQPLFAEVA
jgi:RNA polymerase sigma factor FliA